VALFEFAVPQPFLAQIEFDLGARGDFADGQGFGVGRDGERVGLVEAGEDAPLCVGVGIVIKFTGESMNLRHERARDLGMPGDNASVARVVLFKFGKDFLQLVGEGERRRSFVFFLQGLNHVRPCGLGGFGDDDDIFCRVRFGEREAWCNEKKEEQKSQRIHGTLVHDFVRRSEVNGQTQRFSFIPVLRQVNDLEAVERCSEFQMANATALGRCLCP